jgi:hypothetical protein
MKGGNFVMPRIAQEKAIKGSQKWLQETSRNQTRGKMRELSQKEYQMQSALGTLSKYKVMIERIDNGRDTILCSIPVKAANVVDALHKAWKKKRRGK